MNGEVLKAKVSTLSDWAVEFRNDGRPGASEVAFMLSRCVRAMSALAADMPIPEEVVPVRDQPMDEPHPG